ncbi:MAG TPA: DUF2304 domain-containing protein [Kofleriaceae bacterium]|jgi:hypothetical protein
MGQTTDEYLVFAAACLLIAIVLVRLLLRERITLQGSMSYVAFLVLLGAMAVFPRTTDRVAHFLGFTLMSNFLFCTAIAALAILHLRALVTLSKVHLRSVTLTQELALVQERLDRLDGRASEIAPRANPSAR